MNPSTTTTPQRLEVNTLGLAVETTAETLEGIQFYRESALDISAQTFDVVAGTPRAPSDASHEDKDHTYYTLTGKRFQHLLHHCSLGERRPADDISRLDAMVKHANLIITAWHDNTLVGVARAMTDFSYTCYLSDLAVDDAYQCRGIGKNLLALIEASTHQHCKLILIAAPDANAYYAPLGFEHNLRCWVRK